MKTSTLIIFFILVIGLTVSLGCTTIPAKNPVANGSITTPLFHPFNNQIIPGESYIFEWSTTNKAINEVRFWDFRNNSFLVTTVPVDRYGHFEYMLSANETRTFRNGYHLLILQYPEGEEGFTVVYDNTTGEVIRLFEDKKQVLARINQSDYTTPQQIEKYLGETLKNRVYEGTLFFAPVDVSPREWLYTNSDEHRNFTRGEMIHITGTTSIYPGYLLACVCNNPIHGAFVSSGWTCCSDNVRKGVDIVNVRDGTYTISLVMDSNDFKSGKYTALIWSTEKGDITAFANFSVSDSPEG